MINRLSDEVVGLLRAAASQQLDMVSYVWFRHLVDEWYYDRAELARLKATTVSAVRWSEHLDYQVCLLCGAEWVHDADERHRHDCSYALYHDKPRWTEHDWEAAEEDMLLLARRQKEAKDHE